MTPANLTAWASRHPEAAAELRALLMPPSLAKHPNDCAGCLHGEAFADSDLSAPACKTCVNLSNHTEATRVVTSEAAVQANIRLAASRRGILLFRNNSGALADERGRFVRFGLANDSAAVNARLKSGDLIGCEPLTVTAEMVGSTVGRFLSVECKPPGWRYSGKGREVAQRHWAELITAAGGRAVFATGEGVL